MIPATWVAHIRDDDGELLGYLDTGDEGMLARTVFGFPLGVAGDEAAARSTLDSIGLSYLAERWMLALPSREERITVEIVEATPRPAGGEIRRLRVRGRLRYAVHPRGAG